jgi:hypothetical protein
MPHPRVPCAEILKWNINSVNVLSKDLQAFNSHPPLSRITTDYALTSTRPTHVFEQKHVCLTSSKGAHAEDLLHAANLHREVMSEIQELEVLIHDTTGIKPFRAILPVAKQLMGMLEAPGRSRQCLSGILRI